MASVRKTITVSAPASEVWALVGDFHGLAGWLPGIASSTPDEGGSVRRLALEMGGEVVERLEEHDEAGRSQTYSITESPLPLENYRGTIAVRETGDGCEVEWAGTFTPVGAPEADVVAIVEGIYDAGLSTLKDRFGS